MYAQNKNEMISVANPCANHRRLATTTTTWKKQRLELDFNVRARCCHLFLLCSVSLHHYRIHLVDLIQVVVEWLYCNNGKQNFFLWTHTKTEKIDFPFCSSLFPFYSLFKFIDLHLIDESNDAMRWLSIYPHCSTLLLLLLLLLKNIIIIIRIMALLDWKKYIYESQSSA